MKWGKFVSRVVSDELKSERMRELENVVNELIEKLEEESFYVFNLLQNCISTAVQTKRKKFSLEQLYEILFASYEVSDVKKLLLLVNQDVDARKLEVIRLALRDLDEEQIKFALGFALRKDFDELQLRQILLGLKQGLTKEQVSVYAKSEFDYSQMSEIRIGFVRGFGVQKIQEYANHEYTRLQMRAIRAGWLLGWEKAKSLEVIDAMSLLAFAHVAYQVLFNEELLDFDEDGRLDKVFASQMLEFDEKNKPEQKQNRGGRKKTERGV